MKAVFRTLILLLTLVLALCTAVGCSDKKNDNLDKFDQLLLSTDDPVADGDAFASAIYVVIPRQAGFNLSACARGLVDAIASKTGIETFLKYDYEPTADDSFELLVGYTSRLISQENLSTLRDDDYICRYDRGCIVLGGKSDEATIAAIERFAKDILPGASYAALMSEYAHFESYGDYPVDELTLNGFPIYEYTVAYCSESYEIADLICESIKNSSGYMLTSDVSESYDPQSNRRIWLLLDSTLGEEASISAENGNIILSASDLCGLSLAASTFTSRLVNADSGVTFEGSTVLDYSQSSIDVAFGFLDNTGNLDVELFVTLSEAIAKIESSIVCFYPLRSALAQHVELSRRNDHTALMVDLGDGMSLPILYKTSAFSSVSTERRDGSVWINATAADGKLWRIRIEDGSDEPIIYNSNEILLLSGSHLGDGLIDRIATVSYGNSFNKTENTIYSESADCIKSETVAELSKEKCYFGIFSVDLVEKYHESFINLKETLK